MTAAPGANGIAIKLVIRRGDSQSHSCLRCPVMPGQLHRKLVLHASRRHASCALQQCPATKQQGQGNLQVWLSPPGTPSEECIAECPAAAQPWQTSCCAHLCTHPSSIVSSALGCRLPLRWRVSLGIALGPCRHVNGQHWQDSYSVKDQGKPPDPPAGMQASALRQSPQLLYSSGGTVPMAPSGGTCWRIWTVPLQSDAAGRRCSCCAVQRRLLPGQQTVGGKLLPVWSSRAGEGAIGWH